MADTSQAATWQKWQRNHGSHKPQTPNGGRRGRTPLDADQEALARSAHPAQASVPHLCSLPLHPLPR